jgi:UPF0042 nucleotide-binding protein
VTASPNDLQPTTLVVVTGLSGAGRSTAVAALEDLGFFCVDNLPTPVVRLTLDALAQQCIRKIAFGIDVRIGAFFEHAANLIAELNGSANINLSVLFLDASDEALLRRYGSTRRPHPLSTVGVPGTEREAAAVIDGITVERRQLASLRSFATTVIDTTTLSVHELRRRIIELYRPGSKYQPNLRTRVVSFGFKYGCPIDADLVFDVRFLSNPFFVDSLRRQTGKDDAVREYVLGNDEGARYLEVLTNFLDFCLPRFEREGRSYLTIAVGCTGGQHRSVAVAEAIGLYLRKKTANAVDVIHRDAERNRESDAPNRGGEQQRGAIP